MRRGSGIKAVGRCWVPVSEQKLFIFLFIFIPDWRKHAPRSGRDDSISLTTGCGFALPVAKTDVPFGPKF